MVQPTLFILGTRKAYRILRSSISIPALGLLFGHSTVALGATSETGRRPVELPSLPRVLSLCVDSSLARHGRSRCEDPSSLPRLLAPLATALSESGPPGLYRTRHLPPLAFLRPATAYSSDNFAWLVSSRHHLWGSKNVDDVSIHSCVPTQAYPKTFPLQVHRARTGKWPKPPAPELLQAEQQPLPLQTRNHRLQTRSQRFTHLPSRKQENHEITPTGPKPPTPQPESSTSNLMSACHSPALPQAEERGGGHTNSPKYPTQINRRFRHRNSYRQQFQTAR